MSYDILKIIGVLIATPILGCIMAGLDRKITARLQGRVGPSVLQPFYDVIKLFNKENAAVSKFQNLYVLIYLAFIAASMVMLTMETDLLTIIFVFTVANVALITGAMGTGSPYAKVGSLREIIAMLCYEPIMLLYIVGLYILSGSFRIGSINLMDKPMLVTMPVIFVAMVFVMVIKLKKSPLDLSTSHHGHQELVKGITTEYSGPALAIIEISHWYESVFLSGLMFLFFKQNILLGILSAGFAYLCAIILDNICARLTWQWMIKVTWGIVIELCAINILFLYFFRMPV